MKRAWIVCLLALGCVTYEYNPDAGSEDDDGGEIWRDDAGDDDGGWEDRDGGGEIDPDWDGGGFDWDGGIPNYDGGFRPPDNCRPGSRKGLCIPITPRDAGVIDPPRTDYPGSGADGDPGAAVLFLIRVDRSTANLADRYGVMVGEAMERFSARGLYVHTYAIASLYTGELVWTTSSGVAPADAIRNKAAATDGNPVGACTTTSLATLAGGLPSLTDSSGVPVYANPFSAFLTVVIDSGARPYAPSASQCNAGGNTAIGHFSTDPAGWLVSPEARSLPRPQVKFVTVSTPENLSTSEMKTRCAATDMESSAIDALEASPVAFFGPFNGGLNANQANSAVGLDYCSAYAGGWNRDLGELLTSWVSVLRAQPSWY